MWSHVRILLPIAAVGALIGGLYAIHRLTRSQNSDEQESCQRCGCPLNKSWCPYCGNDHGLGV